MQQLLSANVKCRRKARRCVSGLLTILTNHITALVLMELTKHCWEQHRHHKTPASSCLSERQQIHTTTVRWGFFSPLCISHDASDPPPNDKVLIDFKRAQQDWAEKELKKEMPSESLVGGEKSRIVSSLQLLLLQNKQCHKLKESFDTGEDGAITNPA